MSISLLPGAEYQGHEAQALGSTLYASLRTVFRQVLIVPGERYYFLASDSSLDIHIGELIEQRGVHTDYVNRDYLVDEQLRQRSGEITSRFSREHLLNMDYHPICFFQHTLFWATAFGENLSLFALPLLFIFFAVSFKTSAVGGMVFTAGATGASLQVILLFGLQILCGSLYLLSGALIASSMAGLTVGTIAATRWGDAMLRGRFFWIQVLLSLSALLVLVTLLVLQSVSASNLALTGIFSALAFGGASMVGAQYAIGVRLSGEHQASNLYALDLVGSAIGAALVTLCILPLWGMQVACIAVMAMSALGACRVRYFQR
jgi:hypothetical protein